MRERERECARPEENTTTREVAISNFNNLTMEVDLLDKKYVNKHERPVHRYLILKKKNAFVVRHS